MRQRAKRSQFSLKIQCLPNAIDENGGGPGVRLRKRHQKEKLSRRVRSEVAGATGFAKLPAPEKFRFASNGDDRPVCLEMAKERGSLTKGK